LTTPDPTASAHPSLRVPPSESELFRKATKKAFKELEEMDKATAAAEQWADLAHVLYLALTGRNNWRTAVTLYEETAYSPEDAADLAAKRKQAAVTSPRVSCSSEE
jgi:hypothetical protein